MSLMNREKLCVNREKSAPKIHHFFTVSFSPFTSSRLVGRGFMVCFPSPEFSIPLSLLFSDLLKMGRSCLLTVTSFFTVGLGCSRRLAWSFYSRLRFGLVCLLTVENRFGLFNLQLPLVRKFDLVFCAYGSPTLSKKRRAASKKTSIVSKKILNFLEVLENSESVQKQKRIRPFSRDPGEYFRDSRDSSSEKTPFVMTPFSGPEFQH